MSQCSCCDGCLVRRQRSVQNCFPKKLLVATSVVVIITMCLIPAEAQPAHRMRHSRRTRPNNDEKVMITARVEQRQRPYRKQTQIMMQAKETDSMRLQKHAQAERFKNATKKILSILKNTRNFFEEEKKVLNESKVYRGGMPDWLPAISFVDIHSFNYKRRPRASPTERKFRYLIPKLYKSLVEYQDIFKHLGNVQVDFPDDPFFNYNKTRHELIGSTSRRLYSTICEIEENMRSVNIPVPKLHPNKNLNKLAMRVNAPQCLKHDYIAFRAYGNLLSNWNLEFRCPRGKNFTRRKGMCIDYEAELKKKKEARDKRKAENEKKPTK